MSNVEKADPRNLVGTELAGRYQVESVVEEGGFGVIYKGVHNALKKPVAIKVLKTPKEYSESVLNGFVQNFTLEAQTIAKMTHPNIVQVLDFGVSTMPNGEQAPWMVMEWLDGKPLSRFLRARNGLPLTPRETLDLMQPVMEALSFAHEQRIAHRDLKPANIMLIETKRGPFPKLLDFGIAKVMGEDENVGSGQTQTRSATWAFSPRYAAPEQLSQARTGPWTDVHALGLIITEMITGRPAIESTGKDTTQMYSQILRPERPTPATKGCGAGPWEPVLAKSMSLSPQERYADAGALLGALLADVPTTVSGTLTDIFASQTGGISDSPSTPSTHPTGTVGKGLTTISGTSVVVAAPPATAQVAPRRNAFLFAGVALVVGGAITAALLLRPKPTVNIVAASAPPAAVVQPSAPVAVPVPVVPTNPAQNTATAPPAVVANPQPPPSTPTVVANTQPSTAVPNTTDSSATTAQADAVTDGGNTAAETTQEPATGATARTNATHPPQTGRPNGRKPPAGHGSRQGLGFDLE